MRKLLLLLPLCLCFLLTGCQPASSSNRPPDPPTPPAPPPTLRYRIVNMYPHDPRAFTQGLIFNGGKIVESTGQEGRSSLRNIELATGSILKKVEVPSPYFAEGIALLNGKIYQLTWQHKLGFIYDAQTFEKVGQFNYEGEGWGLATDGKSLLLSDGTNQIRFIDPGTFRVTKTLTVMDGKTPIQELNELEYVKGEIYANIWHDDRVAVINPETGLVKAWIDLEGLLQPGDVDNEEAVLNGIAYDEAANRLFVTGKLWPRLFEIEIKK